MDQTTYQSLILEKVTEMEKAIVLNKVDELISSWKTNRWKYYMGPFHGHIAKPLTLFPLGM